MAMTRGMKSPFEAGFGSPLTPMSTALNTTGQEIRLFAWSVR
jgi:hypothetical protein